MAGLFSGPAVPKVEKTIIRKLQPVAPAPAPVPVAEIKPEPQVYLVQIMNGSKRSEEKFNATEEEAR